MNGYFISEFRCDSQGVGLSRKSLGSLWGGLGKVHSYLQAEVSPLVIVAMVKDNCGLGCVQFDSSSFEVL